MEKGISRNDSTAITVVRVGRTIRGMRTEESVEIFASGVSNRRERWIHGRIPSPDALPICYLVTSGNPMSRRYGPMSTSMRSPFTALSRGDTAVMYSCKGVKKTRSGKVILFSRDEESVLASVHFSMLSKSLYDDHVSAKACGLFSTYAASFQWGICKIPSARLLSHKN